MATGLAIEAPGRTPGNTTSDRRQRTSQLAPREAVAVSLASTVAGTLRRAARALAATPARRERRGDWQSAARERYLGHAVDLSDLERRQRAWDRDESNSWSMSGWS